MSTPPSAFQYSVSTSDIIRALDEEEEEEEETVAAMTAMLAGSYTEPLYNKSRVRDSILSGHNYTQELLNGHPRRFQEKLRMPRPTFFLLRNWLLTNTALTSTKGVTIEEKLAMFLMIVGQGASNRTVQERYQHAGDTVTNCFHQVLFGLVKMHKERVKLPDPSLPVCAQIASNPKFTPYFDDCLGALDGTHIDMHVPASMASAYRNRKGSISQNVLAACTFDLRFCYILPGWEGSAHDSRILTDALYNEGFFIPNGKYYLGDAGYSNKDYLLCPYRGVQYHLKEQKQAAQRPENAKELFNLRHASLRNAIERIFGVCKRRFQILKSAAEYDNQTQIDIVFAVTALHNFIMEHRQSHNEVDMYLSPTELDEDDIVEDGDSTSVTEGSTSAGMNDMREQLAAQMWKDYQDYLAITRT